MRKRKVVCSEPDHVIAALSGRFCFVMLLLLLVLMALLMLIVDVDIALLMILRSRADSLLSCCM